VVAVSIDVTLARKNNLHCPKQGNAGALNDSKIGMETMKSSIHESSERRKAMTNKNTEADKAPLRIRLRIMLYFFVLLPRKVHVVQI
jgi:hypothetical protein